MADFTVVLLSLFNILSLLVGYFLGRYSIEPEAIEKKIKELRRGKTELGVVNRPTAETLAKRGTKEEAEEKVMTEAFDKLME